VRVPDEAGEGKAEVKVSFAALTAFKVADSTGTLMIRKAPAPEAVSEPAEAPKDAPAPKPAEGPAGAPPAK
jgi:hypothetical protein